MDGRTNSVVAQERPQPHRNYSPPASPSASQWILLGARSFRIRAAVSRDERASANSLIQRMYAGRGYTANALTDEPCAKRLTLVASTATNVIGTMTIGFDSEQRLSVDEFFPDEVSSIRASGRQVCEFTKLAIDGSVQSHRVLAAMFHVAFIHAHRMRGCDNLLIEVNPRHCRYYETKLGFKAVGLQRLNHRVNAPAVLLSLDLWHGKEQIDTFGGKPELAADERSLYPYFFSAVEEARIVERLRRKKSEAAATPRKNELREGQTAPVHTITGRPMDPACFA